MRKFKKQDDEAEINMTPMLDIVFIMLIFFIVTASFVKEHGLDVNKPDNDNPPPPDPDKKNIIIKIDNNNQIFIDFRRVDIRSVRANIERLHAENPEGMVVIQALPDSHAGLIVEIYDQALLSGVKNVSIAE
ncbi:MAG: biopolymer transporter ExbD [Sphingomonadales bacterium]|nr:biopolymer transporter ExbD [Sphingomonadales bacterium]